MRELTVKGAKTRAWSALSRYVRARDKICVTCKKNPSTQAGHYRHNGDKPNKQLGGNALWYDERNIGGQDSHCNLYKSGKPVEFALYLEGKYGKGILQELQRLFLTPKKWTIPELLEVEKYYENKTSVTSGYSGGYQWESEPEISESYLLPTADFSTPRQKESNSNHRKRRAKQVGTTESISLGGSLPNTS